eukprot:6213847-Pleurochrysis_carterae.AAC.4
MRALERAITVSSARPSVRSTRETIKGAQTRAAVTLHSVAREREGRREHTSSSITVSTKRSRLKGARTCSSDTCTRWHVRERGGKSAQARASRSLRTRVARYAEGGRRRTLCRA